MKKLLNFRMIVIMAVALVSCNSDDNGEEPTPTVDLRVEVDGVVFEPGVIITQMTSMGRYIAITSSTSAGAGNSLAISIGSLDDQEPVLAPGTYSTVDGNTALFYTIAGTTSYQTFDTEAVGQITITALDTETKTISGTFQGTVKNLTNDETIELTNGEFNNLTYLEQ